MATMSKIHFEYEAEGDMEPRVSLVLDEPSKEKQVARLAHIFMNLIELFGDDVVEETLAFLQTVAEKLRR